MQRNFVPIKVLIGFISRCILKVTPSYLQDEIILKSEDFNYMYLCQLRFRRPKPRKMWLISKTLTRDNYFCQKDVELEKLAGV